MGEFHWAVIIPEDEPLIVDLDMDDDMETTEPRGTPLTGQGQNAPDRLRSPGKRSMQDV